MRAKLIALLIVAACGAAGAEVYPGGAFTVGGVSVPICRIDGAEGVTRRLRGVGSPAGICGQAEDGALVAVVDATTKTDCSVGGGTLVSTCQYDASAAGANKWVTAQSDDTQAVYTPADSSAWFGAGWLPSGSFGEALDTLAGFVKAMFGYYDVIVDVTGDANACATAQRLAIKPFLDDSDSSPAKAERRVWIRGVSTGIAQANLKDYTNERDCLVLGGGSTDANGYPTNLATRMTGGKRLHLDLSGLRLGVSQSGQTKATVVVRVGGNPASWENEFSGDVNAAIYLSGSPSLECGGNSPTWDDARLNAMSGSGQLFSGGEWSSGSCVALLEQNSKRQDWTGFHPRLRSGGGAANVGWLSVWSWATQRGLYTASGFGTAFQVLRNHSAGSVTVKAEGGGYGFVCGDRNQHSCNGLRVSGAQLEGMKYAEVLLAGGLTSSSGGGPSAVSFENMHIESEGSPPSGYRRSAHVLIGPGFGGSVDGYRPCWRDADLPSGASCSCPYTADSREVAGVSFANSDMPSDRLSKAFRLSGYSNRSGFAACATSGATVTFDTSPQSTAKVYAGIDDSWWGTDRLVVYGYASSQYQPTPGSTVVTCGAHTAIVSGYGGGNPGIALGPCAELTGSRRDKSLISFPGTVVAHEPMADVEALPYTYARELFVAHPAANAHVDFSASGGLDSKSEPPATYPSGSVTGSGVGWREHLHLPVGGCNGTAPATLWTSTAADRPQPRCVAGGSDGYVAALSFDDASSEVARLVLPFPAEMRCISATSCYADLTLLWRSATATNGAARMRASIDCRGVGDPIPPSVGTPTTALVTPNASAGYLQNSAIGRVKANGCDPGDLAWVSLWRDGAHVDDTLVGDAEVVGLDLSWPRVQR